MLHHHHHFLKSPQRDIGMLLKLYPDHWCPCHVTRRCAFLGSTLLLFTGIGFLISDSRSLPRMVVSSNLPETWTMFGSSNKLPPRAHVRPCTQEYRLGVMKKTCDVYHQFDKRRGPEDVLEVVAINHDKKILYCALPKSGSRSWLTYMVNVTGKAKENTPWNIRNSDYMAGVGLDYRKKVSVNEVLTNYANYTKFTVVRHPFQWIVALYYEAILNVDKYMNEDGSKSTLQEFVNRLPIYPLFQTVWNSYENHCHHCAVDYDYIVKAETVAEDGKLLSQALNTDVLPPFTHVNTRAEQDSQNFKYDNLLRELGINQTNIFQKRWLHYEKEMKMFGYQFDDVNQNSVCSNWDEKGDCC